MTSSSPEWRDMNTVQRLGVIFGAAILALIALIILGGLVWTCQAVWTAVFN